MVQYVGVSYVAAECSQAVNHHRAVDTDSQRPERLSAADVCLHVCVRVSACVCTAIAGTLCSVKRL